MPLPSQILIPLLGQLKPQRFYFVGICENTNLMMYVRLIKPELRTEIKKLFMRDTVKWDDMGRRFCLDDQLLTNQRRPLFTSLC
jgi:hypothetical protein